MTLLIVITVVAIAENVGTNPNLNCSRSEVCFACELIFKVYQVSEKNSHHCERDYLCTVVFSLNSMYSGSVPGLLIVGYS